MNAEGALSGLPPESDRRPPLQGIATLETHGENFQAIGEYMGQYLEEVEEVVQEGMPPLVAEFNTTVADVERLEKLLATKEDLKKAFFGKIKKTQANYAKVCCNLEKEAAFEPGIGAAQVYLTYLSIEDQIPPNQPDQPGFNPATPPANARRFIECPLELDLDLDPDFHSKVQFWPPYHDAIEELFADPGWAQGFTPMGHPELMCFTAAYDEHPACRAHFHETTATETVFDWLSMCGWEARKGMKEEWEEYNRMVKEVNGRIEEIRKEIGEKMETVLDMVKTIEKLEVITTMVEHLINGTARSEYLLAAGRINE